MGLQCKLEELPVVCATCKLREQEAETISERFLNAVGASPTPPTPTTTTRTIGVGDCKLIEDPPDPTAFRDIGICTEKWVEVIKASKQTDTEDFAFKGIIHILHKHLYSTKFDFNPKFFTKTGFFSSKQKNFFFNTTF